jgi:predicted RNA-binding Zn ribbon-like protein
MARETPPIETTPRPEGIRELPIVGGDLALDFANTVDDPLGPERWDHISAYGDLLVWSVRAGVMPAADAETLARRSAADPHGTRSVIAHARDLRESLNATFGAVVDGTDVAGPWALLRPYAQVAVGHADLPAAGYQTWSFTELESPLWPVAAAAYRLLTSGRAAGKAGGEAAGMAGGEARGMAGGEARGMAGGEARGTAAGELARLKRCVGCPWLFLDRSKNGSRRWCSMEMCGTDEKVRRYVRKRAAKRA